MALKTPYADLTYADSVLFSDDWVGTSNADREYALMIGRYYIDSKFSCAYFDEDTPPDDIKMANCLLAEDYVQGTLLRTSAADDSRVVRKRVKAGSVESETEYLPGSYYNSPSQDVLILISDYCSYSGTTHNLVRA